MTYTLSKIGHLLDERDGSWQNIFVATSIEGELVEIAVPREVRDNALYRYLLGKGAILPPFREVKEHLAAVADADAPVKHRAARNGWYKSGDTFVSHQFVEGRFKDRLLPLAPGALGRFGGLEAAGTIEEWQKLVAVAQHSTTITVALCAAFSAYLLSPLGRPSFALVFVGPSRCGKSTAQLVAGSVVGFGQEEQLMTMNATASGLLETAIIFNDHVLPINEVGTAHGQKSDVSHVIRETIYALTSGSDTTRHSAWNGSNIAPGTFKVLPLFSSELSPDDWAARGGETRDPGETARLIAVPVVADGQTTVFDKPPAACHVSPNDWSAVQFEHLRVGLACQHGTAGPAFLHRFMANMDGYLRKAAEDITHAQKALTEMARSAIERDIAAKFSVLYAGGMAAARSGVLPLQQMVLERAILHGCRAALGALPNPEAHLHLDLVTLKRHLESGGIVNGDDLSAAARRGLRQADGFYRRENMGWLYVIRAKTFATWYPSAARTRSVLEWLDDEGLLRHYRERRAGKSNVWAQAHTSWPDGTRTRSICIYICGSLDVFDAAV